MRIAIDYTAASRQRAGIGRYTRSLVNALARLDTTDQYTLYIPADAQYLDDTRDFWSFNRVYREYFGDRPPARSCVRAQMMVDCKIEIEAIAYRPLG